MRAERENAPVGVKDSLALYLDKVRSIWGDGKDRSLPHRIKDLLEELLKSTSPREPWLAQLIHEGLPAKELYRDQNYGFIQMAHVYDKGHGTAPHDHGPGWVLYGVCHGAVLITTYRRTDNGEILGRAILEKQAVQRLIRGEVAPYFPGDIHATLTAEPSVVLRFLSCDLSKAQRHRYDLEKESVSVIRSTHAEEV